MHPRLKKIIFNKLYEDLKHVEIIHFEDSIWFIDREKEYWYLEYKKNGLLWWRYQFFNTFFLLFSMQQHKYDRVIAEWVEEVLNFKVNITTNMLHPQKFNVEEVLNFKVEDVLNLKVDITKEWFGEYKRAVEEALNCKVDVTEKRLAIRPRWVEEVLNFKVDKTATGIDYSARLVGEVLNYKVDTTRNQCATLQGPIEEILKLTVNQTCQSTWGTSDLVEDVLTGHFITITNGQTPDLVEERSNPIK